MSGYLRGGVLTRMRSVAVASMGDTCQVVRDTLTEDGAGGQTTAPATIAAVRCGVRSVGSGNERELADKLGWTVAYAIRLPLGTDVTPADKLVVSGRTFEIGGILKNGATATAMTAICQEQSP